MSYQLITNSFAMTNGTNTEFRVWGQAFGNCLANCGWTKATGVGTQIDWTTVAAPTTVSESKGYEIWQMGDALQATAPIYVKIEYGSSAGSSLYPGTWWTLGAGANSSGNITGNTSGRIVLHQGSYYGSNIAWYSSGDTDRFSYVWGNGDGVRGRATMMGIERLVDANGTPTNNGAVLLYANGSSVLSIAWTPTLGNVTAVESTWGCFSPPSNSTTLGANSTAFGLPGGGQTLSVHPVFPAGGTFKVGFMNPTTLFMGYFNNDFPALTLATINVYGNNHTYLPLGNTPITSASARGGARSAVMVRWD